MWSKTETAYKELWNVEVLVFRDEQIKRLGWTEVVSSFISRSPSNCISNEHSFSIGFILVLCFQIPV